MIFTNKVSDSKSLPLQVTEPLLSTIVFPTITGLFPIAGLDAGRCVCRVTLMAFGGMLPAEAKLQGRMFQRKALMSSEELVFLRRAAVSEEAMSAINGHYSTCQPGTVAMSSMAPWLCSPTLSS